MGASQTLPLTFLSQMTRLESFRQSSSRFATLIEPSEQLTNLCDTDVADLVECLDYSRLSTTPRRKSQAGAERSLVSNLPSPLFDDFLNLLPSYNLRGGSNSGHFDFADFSVETPPPQQHQQSSDHDQGPATHITTNMPDGGNHNDLAHSQDGDSSNTLSHVSPTNTHSHPHQPQAQQQEPHFYPHQLTQTSHKLSPLQIGAETMSATSLAMGPLSSHPNTNPVIDPPYRRQSFCGGKRPWYEQQQQTTTVDDVHRAAGDNCYWADDTLKLRCP